LSSLGLLHTGPPIQVSLRTRTAENIEISIIAFAVLFTDESLTTAVRSSRERAGGGRTVTLSSSFHALDTVLSWLALHLVAAAVAACDDTFTSSTTSANTGAIVIIEYLLRLYELHNPRHLLHKLIPAKPYEQLVFSMDAETIGCNTVTVTHCFRLKCPKLSQQC
jgi:hypothetical protein